MSVDDAFFDRVAHDLRGELSTMVAGVHYLLRYGDSLTPAAREMLGRVSGAGERLARLLEELDDAVWLLETPKDLQRMPIQFGALLDDVVARVGKVAASRGARLVVELPEHSSEIMGDPDVLAAALAYVVDLAALRSRDQAVHISAEVRDGAPWIRVVDEAGPVPQELLDRIFEPFIERELLPKEQAGRRKLRLGVGMTIARAMLEAHGGSLAVELSPGGGGLVAQCKLGALIAASEPTENARAASG